MCHKLNLFAKLKKNLGHIKCHEAIGQAAKLTVAVVRIEVHRWLAQRKEMKASQNSSSLKNDWNLWTRDKINFLEIIIQKSIGRQLVKTISESF